MKKIELRLLAVLIMFLCFGIYAQAQDQKSIQANNPLANMKTLNLQNYYMPSLYGSDDASANQFFVRYAQPIGRVLVRATLPVSIINNGGQDYTSGLGDFQAFGTYLFTSPSSANQIGLGPLVVAPTSKSGLGSNRWQGGLAFVTFFASNPKVQYGSLVTWQSDFAGSEKENKSSMMNIQPFAMWQLGSGTYIRSSATWTLNFVNGGVNIPFGLGIGKVLEADKLTFNLFAEAQYSVYDQKYTGSKAQIFTGVNMQF